MGIVYNTLQTMENLLEFVIFIRIIISWIPYISRDNPIVNLIYALTEPILSPIREIIKKSPIGGVGMTLDFSPVIALLVMRAIVSIIGGFISA